MKPIRWISLAAVMLLASCAGMNRVEHWPYRGSLITVINDQTEPVSVVAHSPLRGGHLVSHRLWPKSRITFRWPWIDDTGIILATPWSTMSFNPWDASYWCWYVSQQRAEPRQCPD